jgi:beta-lactam-binding protein with PASTA domain
MITFLFGRYKKVLKIKLPVGLVRFFSNSGHYFRSVLNKEGDKTEFGREKPKVIADLQKKKWLWSIISGFLMIIALIFVTATTAYITMVLSIKGENVSVPDLYKMTTEDAVRLLSDLDLKLKISDEHIFSKDIEEGRVMRQEPAAGTSVKRNVSIRVVLSAGIKTIIVPSLVGNSARDAAAVFAKNGLNLTNISEIYCNYMISNNIIAQEPLPGSAMIKGSRVNILVSLGAREKVYVMPDLIGQDYSRVINRLEGAGFRIGNVFYHDYPGAEPRIIIMQFPKAGYSIHKSDIINLWVSK